MNLTLLTGEVAVLAQQVNELSMYRINAVIGDSIRLLYCVAWSEMDAHHKIGERMRSEHIPLYTLHTLDRRPL